MDRPWSMSKQQAGKMGGTCCSWLAMYVRWLLTACPGVRVPLHAHSHRSPSQIPSSWAWALLFCGREMLARSTA